MMRFTDVKEAAANVVVIAQSDIVVVVRLSGEVIPLISARAGKAAAVDAVPPPSFRRRRRQFIRPKARGAVHEVWVYEDPTHYKEHE